MKIGVIFDLDQTLIDSSISAVLRKDRKWAQVYNKISSYLPYEQMDEVLKNLELKNIPYCIVTSSQGQYCKRVCMHWNFKHDTAVCYHDTNNKKPHPDPILLAVNRLNIPAHQVFSFGDSVIDIQASNAANTQSVACLWGADDKTALIKADPKYVLEQPFQIIELLEKNFDV